MKSLLIAIFVITLSAQVPDDSLVNKIDSLVRQGQLSAAENSAREYLQAHKESAEAHFLLGYVLFTQKRANESLAEYTEGAKYHVPGARDLKVVASDYVILGDFTDADTWFSKVVEWTPDDAQAWYDLGRTKYNENRFEEAIQAFRKVLKLEPGNVKAEDNLGLSYGALGQNEDAIAAYQRAISLQNKFIEKNAGPYLDYGSLLIEANREEEALPLLNEALALTPSDFRVHRELGKAYLHLNQLKKSEAELEKAIDLSPKNAPLHFMLAQVYRKQGLMEKAKRETEKYTALK